MYDLRVAGTLEPEDVDVFALGRIHVRQDCARKRFLRARRSGIEEGDLANIREQVHHLDDAEGDAGLGELAPQQVEPHEGEDAVEGMDPELLVGPVEGRPEGQVMRIFQPPEVSLDMVLGAVAEDDLLIGPVCAVSEDDRFAQERRGEVPVGLLAKADGESRQAGATLAYRGGGEIRHWT